MKNSKSIDTNATRRRLARQLADVLANPTSPAALPYAITDELAFYVELADDTRPRVAELSLFAYDENRAEIEASGEKPNAAELIG